MDTDLSKLKGSLHIADVRGMNGSFQCRAINDFGAEFSDVAVLTVLGIYDAVSKPVTLVIFPLS